MLSKCANPTCPTTFRYLHEGRLFVIAPRATLAERKPRCASKRGQLECAWLCSSCSLHLTIQTDEEFGTRVVRKLEAKNGSELRASTKDTEYFCGKAEAWGWTQCTRCKQLRMRGLSVNTIVQWTHLHPSGLIIIIHNVAMGLIASLPEDVRMDYVKD
jgi:hypothetical protein